MCLIAFALNASARWPLVIASNRDEFLHRPTLPLQRWTTPAGVDVVSGRDLEAGGTWLGVTPAGRVAMLTNVREAQQTPASRTRGDLPLAWLTGSASAPDFLQQLQNEGAAQAYGGFNLVIGDVRQGHWMWASNRQGLAADMRPGWQSQPLGTGVYGLSNAFLDTSWPKTERIKTALTQALASEEEAALTSHLWQALSNRAVAASSELPKTGVPDDWEQALSSAFVSHPDRGYATRCSTLLLMQAANENGHTIRLFEKNTDPGADNTAKRHDLHLL